MRKLIAKFLQWCLYKLGYTDTYVKKNTVEVHIEVHSHEAIKKLKQLIFEAEKLVLLNEKLGIK